MALLYGVVEAFDPTDGDFTEYAERLTQYFLANGVEDEKKVAILLTVIGKDTYSLLRSLVAPAKPHEKSYTDIISALTTHFKPTPITIAERFKFYERNQQPGEKINDFIAAIRALSLKCNFNAFLDEAIRDKLVCGMSSSRTRKRLLVERDLTLNKAIEIANALEVAEVDNLIMDSAVGIKSEENKILTFNRPKCYRCSSEYHLANSCKFIDATCNKCSRRGHLAKACRSKGPYKGDKKHPNNYTKSSESNQMNTNANQNKTDAIKGDKKPTNYSSKSSVTPPNAYQNKIDINNSNDSESDGEVFHIHAFTSCNIPYSIRLAVSGIEITFEIDTGSGVSIISEDTYLISTLKLLN